MENVSKNKILSCLWPPGLERPPQSGGNPYTKEPQAGVSYFDQIQFLFKLSLDHVQLRAKQTTHLLNKHYEN